MIKVFSVAEMVAAEKAADAVGITYDQMMETAGRRTAEAIMARYPVQGANILILVGPGNNGGDGLVAGRYLAEAGADVAFYMYRPRDPEKDHHFAKVQTMGLFIVNAADDQRHRVLQTRLRAADLVMDALLGTGVARPIGGQLAGLMKQVRVGLAERTESDEEPALISIAQLRVEKKDTRPTIVAVDCPSGLNCDTGALDKLAIPADLTVTFAGPKRGHFCFPGAAACGELVVADINIPADLPQLVDVPVTLATAVTAKNLLPMRPRDGHKGTFGWALIAAGSAQYWGAPVLAARGTYRIGAGLVALAVPESIRPTIAGQMPEATYPALDDHNHLSTNSARFLLKAADRYKGMLIGPGLGDAPEFMEILFKSADKPPSLPPLVIDADGLNLLARMPNWPQRLPPNSILTPHLGEIARLMGATLLTEVKDLDRINLASAKAQEWGQVLVLKGAYTVVAAPDGRCTIIPFANPILGAAGSGDVLAGIMVGLLAQGLAPYETAILSAYIHGAAGQLASEQVGDAGLLAGEIADWITAVRKRLLDFQG